MTVAEEMDTLTNKTIIVEDIGLREYRDAWDYQTKLMELTISRKKEKSLTDNYLLFVEHPHVYTLGKSGKEQNMLLNMMQLKHIHADFVQTNRGGDITYHGPGQLVGYPIFDLENFGIGLRRYIFLLEEAIIRVIAGFGLVGERDENATGVWLGLNTSSPRKICAIGVKSSRFVTMHGFALNVNTNLDYFRYINPCGFIDRGVTSLKQETGKTIELQYVKEVVAAKMVEVFCTQIERKE